MNVWIKIHEIISNGRKEIVLGVCDEDLLGKNFDFFKISEKFYKGKIVKVDEAIEYIKKATIVNLVGENIVNKAIKEGIIKKSNIKKIKGIPHAQIFTIYL